MFANTYKVLKLIKKVKLGRRTRSKGETNFMIQP